MKTKNVLIISSSPRRGGNSDLLCDKFLKGAKSSGHSAEKIFLASKKISYCTGCDICSTSDKPCPQKDDAAEIIAKMKAADVIALGTPAYFYAMSAQLKTLIDRCCGDYSEMSNKDFYFIISAADTDADNVKMVSDSLKGFLYCLESAKLKKVVMGLGAWRRGDILNNGKALKEAFDCGRSV